MPKKSKKKTKVAFQGEIGAYSEEAAFKFFGNNILTIPCPNFTDVFKVVKEGAANFGIIPIENSLEGTVGQNYDLLLKSKLKIFGEQALKISHCLIVNKGVKIGSLKKVYSHPQALGQCRDFLAKMKLKAIPFCDTAGSVRMLKKEKLKDSAAIASERAGRIYKMKILKRGLERNSQNFTKFFIISNKQ
jgi:prephenate dehydratase